MCVCVWTWTHGHLLKHSNDINVDKKKIVCKKKLSTTSFKVKRKTSTTKKLMNILKFDEKITNVYQNIY